MKTNSLPILLLFLCTINCPAQIFDIDTIQYMGPTDKRINIVFLGDGYQANEMDKYKQDVINTSNDLFNTTPFQQYQSYFNVFAINVPSEESGASHPGNANDELSGTNHPVSVVNNYFGSTFDFAGIHRLVVAENSFAISNVLANNFPEYDDVVILVNSPFYGGGSGGGYALATTEESASEIAIHEMGHSFTNLSDEYYPGDIYAAETPNMTMETNPDLVKWKNWNGDAEIGIYQHCCGGNSANWYRPHESCKMQSLNEPFCAVCSETFVEAIHDLISPIEAYTPTQLQLDNQGQNIWFKSQIIPPNPNTLAVTWNLNGTDIANATADSLLLQSNSLNTGSNQLSIQVIDQSPLSRSDSHPMVHLYSVNWEIEKKTTSVQILGTQRALSLHLFPNPMVDQLQLEYDLDRASEVQFQLYDLNGRLLDRFPLNRQAAGSHQFQMNVSNYPNGTYLLRWQVDGLSISRKVVKVTDN